MKPKLAGRLLSLYPRRWRRRYEAEFLALLEREPPSLRVLTDVIGAACREHARALMRARTWIAATLALAAGANLYLIVDDTPVAPAGWASSWPSALWTGIEVGSVVLGLAIVLKLFYRRLAARLLSASIAIMLASSVAWALGVGRANAGWLLSRVGPLGLSAGLSCAVSVGLMAAATALTYAHQKQD